MLSDRTGDSARRQCALGSQCVARAGSVPKPLRDRGVGWFAYHLGMIAWTAIAGWAVDPVTLSEVGGSFRATVVVAAPLADVLVLIQNPQATAALASDGEFTVSPVGGGCFRVNFELDSWLTSFGYLALSCPTPTGMRAELIASDTFRALQSEWRVRSVEGGTEVAYAFSAELDLPLPGWMIRRATRNEITAVMNRLVARLEE